ncbi:hypothetical protein OJAV_G00145080 [Oryzias javanicus]|uniref:Uncharacterized protein n=1 Tax=Oryzias javanicus TaxID=123683 RepID=A0A3S2P1B2_ORYJA|nr:hypothetical protein OJAV_G00145080 [Oryzias javanicus]
MHGHLEGSAVIQKAWRRFALRTEDEMQKPSVNLGTSDSEEDRQQTAEELETEFQCKVTTELKPEPGPVQALQLAIDRQDLIPGLLPLFLFRVQC